MRNEMCAIAVALLMAPAAASAQAHNGAIVGFGGVTFGDTASGNAFGAAAEFNVSRHIQAIGEVGRLSDVMPSFLDTALSFTPVDVRVSAFYGEGGVRFVASPQSPVRGYVDATAGVARLRTAYSGPGGPIVNAALRFLDQTEPMLGVGGGVMFHAGPAVFDVGYRYRRILTDSTVATLLTGSDGIGVSQVRIGVGFSF
jgi:hypothetical protein